ncbi:MAG TPA: alpha/beta hydrolase [Xanthomonadaceae bacterium]|jgi:acetyl esterase/lipase
MNLARHARFAIAVGSAITIAVGCAIVLAAAWFPLAASAGPLRDAFMQRRAQQGDGGLLGEEGDRSPAQLPAGIRIVRDVAYGSAARQRFDVYAPPQARNAPVIFMVHGGAWMFGDKSAKNVIENKVSRWVPRGFVFISIDYRMLPEAQVSVQAQDVAHALAYAQQHAAEWGGDPRRFVLMGHSAGAHLVSLVSASPSIATAQGVQPWLGTVALDSAAYDVAKIMQGQHYHFYDRVFGSDPSVWAADSPTTQLSGRIPPFLAVCSSKRQDSCPAAQQFVAKAMSFGTHAEELQQDKTHGEINKDLGADPTYTAQVEAFMAHLDPGIAQLLGR